ncbi:MAG: ABC transporter ATP-binding protein [Planctomycetes bacterium]|nr:ABC transporter ATP-binding protein [Planctomycetota bacterium]
MIEVKGITKFYGSFKALDDVSFHVDKGEVLGFLGPNGAGKSTTMKVLTTFISASEGTASVGGFDVHVYPHEVRKRIGYLPETPPLYGDMTVEDYLKFAGSARGLRGHDLKDRLDTVVSDCGLRNKLKARIVELSKGFKQRTGLAQALIHNPDVLILDEPTSGLDPMQIVEIRKLIERLRENRCIIFSTHILQEATAVADRLVIVNAGKKVADGTVDELASKSVDTQHVRLLVKGADAGLAEPLRNIANVQQVEMQQGPTGYARFGLRVGGGLKAIRTACEEIAALAHGRGFALSELAPEKLTLEQIFLQLLKRGSGTPPKAESGEAESTTKDAKESPKEGTEKSPSGEGDVSPALPEDPDATASATRMTGKPTTSEKYAAEAASETAFTKSQDDFEDDAFDTFKPGETGAPSGDTEYSPQLPPREDD